METLKVLRASCEARYKLDQDGIIQTPGKFEGEPIYVPVLWELALDNWADADTHDGDTKLYFFNATTELLSVFPEIPKGAISLVLWESNNGFIYSGESKLYDADAWADRCCKCSHTEGE